MRKKFLSQCSSFQPFIPMHCFSSELHPPLLPYCSFSLVPRWELRPFQKKKMGIARCHIELELKHKPSVPLSFEKTLDHGNMFGNWKGSSRQNRTHMATWPHGSR